MGGSSIIKLN